MNHPWEYITLDVEASDSDTDDRLDGEGADGWELVAVIVLPRFVRHYFKRPRAMPKSCEEPWP